MDGRHMYIDTLCSTRKGVGALLVLAAYDHAVRKKKQESCLSFSATEEDQRLGCHEHFNKLGFKPIFRDGRVRNSRPTLWRKRQPGICTARGCTSRATGRPSTA